MSLSFITFQNKYPLLKARIADTENLKNFISKFSKKNCTSKTHTQIILSSAKDSSTIS
ncbi:MAG: hypothetical protein ACK4OM_00885 [Alphaproteobacteria bacterium]